ncbi:MAG TPA: hypothetical protein VFD92_02360 [Candidatus Binatia bacterium]|nr:hypothetical protein [Candidatus Binatia bacterium]
MTIAYAAIAVWWLWPLPSAWRDHMPAIEGDSPLSGADWYLIVWSLAWDVHALLTSPLSLFDANSFFPTRWSLAYSEHFLGYVPFFAPTYLATGNPILATNVLVFLTYPLCGLAAYALARRWVDAPAAAIAGFLYAFYPRRAQSIIHFHQLGTFGLPLAILFADRWLERARSRDAWALAAAVATQCLCSFYLGYALVLSYGAVLPALLWRWRTRIDRRRSIGLALALAGALAPVVLLGAPYLLLRARGLIPRYDERAIQALGLVPYFASKGVSDFFRNDSVGPFGYALALAALLPPWRERRGATLIAIVLVAWGAVVAYGPEPYVWDRTVWSPYRVLLRIVPGLSAIRLPSRFLVIAQLGLALLAALGAARLLARAPARARWPAVAALLALVAWAMPLHPFHLRAEVTPENVPDAYRWLARYGGGRAVLELPPAAFAPAARRMYLSTYHHLPIVEGYSGYTPPTPYFIQNIAGRLPSDASLQELVDFVDVGWVLLHGDELGPVRRAAWTRPLPAGLVPIATFGSDRVFRVTRPVADDRRSRLTSAATESFGGAPLGPVASPCAGALSLVKWSDAKPGQRLDLAVDVRNDTATAWPGPAVYPAHSLAVRASLLGPDGSPAAVTEARLPSDVAPHATVRANVVLHRPWRRGPLAVRLELFQREGGSLARCGLAPVDVPLALP